jgi:hypothetical protein
MTPDEAAALLSLGCKYDPRLTERTREDTILAARAWAAAVRHGVSHNFAVAVMVEHYAKPGALDLPRLAPSHLNAAYRRHIERGRDGEVLAAIAVTGVPPTPEYLAAREALRKARA